jgi:hypothetical protein
MKHTVHSASFTEVEIEIPDTCPSCGADFHQEGSLLESNWQDCTVRSHLAPQSPTDPVLHLEPEGETSYGDTYLSSGVMCAHCDRLLEPAAQEPRP